ADARLLPDHLPALRDLPAAALLDRGPRAPGPLRQRLRDHRGRVRAAELPRGPPGPELHASARLRDDRRRPAREDAAAVLRLSDRDGTALRDALEVRDGLQEHIGQAALAAAQARRRRGRRAPRSHRGAQHGDRLVTTSALPDNTGYVAA